MGRRVYRTLLRGRRFARGIVGTMIEGSQSFATAGRAGRRIGHEVEVHDVIGSTNDRASQLLLADGVEGRAIVAEVQSSGRGRLGRSWTSPAGVNLTMSVAIHPALRARDAWQLGPAVALAVADACDHPAIRLKWPNDVVDLDGRKVGGILIETSVHGDDLVTAAIGVGLNVNWSRADMPAELAATATSLLELTGAPVDRVALLDRLLTKLDGEVRGVEAGRSPLARYRTACVTLGAEVRVTTGRTQIVGTAVDLDATGALVVETVDGVITVTGGEVERVRPRPLA
jgi:BirA family transcriptional regulator, biotin operon repressor / biotin---[acetyl-CoA-carboxylase] ligase